MQETLNKLVQTHGLRDVLSHLALACQDRATAMRGTGDKVMAARWESASTHVVNFGNTESVKRTEAK